MTSSRARRLLGAFSVASFLVVLSPARADAECTDAISDVSSRKLFDALVAAKPSDGCTLENVATDRSEIKVDWAKSGQSQEAIRIVPTSCAGANAGRSKLSVTVPDSVAAACPIATLTTKQLVESDALGEPVRVSAPVRFRWLRGNYWVVVAGAATLLASTAGALALRSRRRRHRGA